VDEEGCRSTLEVALANRLSSYPRRSLHSERNRFEQTKGASMKAKDLDKRKEFFVDNKLRGEWLVTLDGRLLAAG